MRLIDADALKEDLFIKFGNQLPNGLFDEIDNAPTVETSKIEHKAYNEGFKDGVDQGIKLSERPQGEWIKTSLYGKTCYECNKCHLHYDFISNFCPNCGADMKGGTE